MYISLSFGFLYGRYVLFSKLNVTSKKSTSVRLVTTSILIFLKILIIFFRILFVCCLFILRRINNPSSLYKPIFDVTMWSYDSAEVCELIGIYIQSLLTNILSKDNMGLYRDDGYLSFVK